MEELDKSNFRKIALVRAHGDIGSYDCEPILHSITDWKEVTEEEFNNIRNALNQLPETRGWVILEQPQNLHSFLGKTLEDFNKYIKLLQKKRIAYEQEQQRLKAERKRKRDLKQLKKLEELKKSLGVV